MVEPHPGRNRPKFVYDYPSSQVALASIRRDDPPVAKRFELYVRGYTVSVFAGMKEEILQADGQGE